MSHRPHWLTALVLTTRALSRERASLLLEGLSHDPGTAAAGLLEELGKLDAVSLRLRVAGLLGAAPDRTTLLRRLALVPPEVRAVALRSSTLRPPDVPPAGARPPWVRWGERLARELRGEGARIGLSGS